MNNRITETIKKFNMLSHGDTVLVGVSGGADSMLLLNFFNENAQSLGITVKAAHIEHGIRGEESLGDAELVKRYCEENGIEFNLLSIDAVNQAKKAGMGVEEYSRKKRYEFFSSIPCDKIATAHNLTDNIETVLFRMTRGTGVKGVCGIPPCRDNIIRPLIEISSSDIRSYCDEKGIPYRIDSTNYCDEYSRNKIRNNILPVLKSLNIDYERHFGEFIEDFCGANECLDEITENALSQACVNGCVSIDYLLGLSEYIRKNVIIKYLSANNIQTDRKHIDLISKLIKKPGRVQISGSLFAVSNKEYLRLADFSQEKCEFTFSGEILNINEFNANNIDFYCDCDKIVGSITVRSRMAGDTVKPIGRNCTKSLKKLFNELAVPVEKRGSVPVIADDLGVIGVVPYCVDQRVAVTKSTERVLSVRLSLEDKE